MGEHALGQPVPRSEDPRLLRGGGRFVDDVRLPNTAYGYVLRSPHPHARITKIDTRAAAQMPGVLEVLTGADWAASGLGDIPGDRGFKKRDGSDMYIPPFPALVKDTVTRVGDYVAFVVADTLAQAKDAAERIEVEYEALPFVVDMEDALAEGAHAVWPDNPDNVCFNHQAGNLEAVEEAFKKSDHVVSYKFHINRITAATTEPRGCTGWYDPFADRYTIYTTLQHANPFRTALATRVFKVPETKMRVVAGDIGGAFGMKSNIYPEVALALWGSMRCGRPVRWTSDRNEAFLSDCQARDNITDAALALDKNGKFLGLRVKNLVNLGNVMVQGGSNPAVGNIGTLAGVYTTPAIHTDITVVFTNTTPTRPYRGAGRPEAAYVIERLVEMAADDLGMDPAEIRRINTIPVDAFPFKTGLTFTYDCGEFEKNMDIALDMADYAGFEARRKEAAGRGRFRGIGLSNTIERAAAPGFEAGEIRFDRSGTATILCGSIAQGQGHETVFKQLVCDCLGLHPDEVHYVWGDTDQVPFGQGTGGSRSATIGGSALHMASNKIVDKSTKIAAHMLEAADGDIEFSEGIFTVAGTDRSVTIKDVARAAADPAKLPDDMETGLTAQASYTAKVMNFPNGCHVVELEIDPDTGTVDIQKYAVVDDVGTVMNPLLLKGQIQGGIAQGLGQALMEDITFEKDTGQMTTGSFMDYAMPRASDMTFIDIVSNPVPTKSNPLGVKGAGEAGTVGALPAITNAIVDALSHLGVRHIEMPATPERIWRAIREAQASA
jgi:carbon-monoxide dehydrogenase large subunit